MREKTKPKGRIEVSSVAIASLVHEALQRSYGVVGTTPKNFGTGIANLLSRASRRGVVVQVRDGAIVIDLYVVVEYGTRIASVTRSAMNLVKYTVEKTLGIPIAEVNVFVEGVHVSDSD